MRKILCLAFIAIYSFSFSQIEEVRRITQALCSPEMHGRGYVNKGDSIAAAFLAAEFKKIGAQPCKKGSYFQKFNLDVNTFPGRMDISIGEKNLIPGKHFMVDPSSGPYSGYLKPKKITIELMLNQEKLIAELKSVLNSSEFNAIAFDLVNLSNDTLKMIAGLSEEFAKYIPVIEVTNKKFTWSVSDRQLQYPLIHIQDSVNEWYKKMNVQIDARKLVKYESRNVIATIPSKNKKAETIVFTAHYDHLGRMGENTYFPGANDNASGTAMLLSMAKYFSENPTVYNLVFIAFAGEEAGLIGSKYFVENPWLKLSKIKFLINLDIMGSGEEGITVVNGTKHKEEFKLLQKINQDNDLLSQVKERGPAANSDHYWFSEVGVPAIFIYTMGPNKNYHDIFDKYEELSFNEYDDITKLLVEFVERLNTVVAQ